MLSRAELDKGFRIGDWEVLPARGEIRSGDQVERPEPKVMAVLMSLAMRGGDVVTKDELVNEVWGGRPTSDDPIIRCIFQLRGHFNDRERPYQYVGTLVRRGYNLEKPVELISTDAATPQARAVETRKMSRLWAIVGLAVVALLAALVFKNVMQPAPKAEIGSIVVMPFKNLTGSSADDFLVSGFRETLSHTLQNIPDLVVKNGHKSYANLSVEALALRLNADGVLNGALQRQGDELRFSYQLARGVDGVNVSSGMVSGNPDVLFDLQEQLAGRIRSHLAGGESKQQLLSSSRPENFQAYERYIRGMFALERRGIAGKLEEAIALFNESIQLDPNYGPAYLALAEIYVLLPDYRGADLVESHAKAIEIVQAGISRDPAIANAAGAVFGFVYHKQKNWLAAEQAFLKATTAAVVESNAFNWYSLMLGSVGRIDEALQQALAAIEIDPGSAVLNSRVALMYTWTADSEKAADFFERGRQLGAAGVTHRLTNALFEARRGNLQQARNLLIAGVESDGLSTEWVDSLFAALEDPAKRAAALAALDDASAAAAIDPPVEATLRMMLDDVDGALAVAREMVKPGKAIETELFFLPEFAPLRQRPEFLELMDAIGATAYWKQANCRWQDFKVVCD